ncbi:hypothetical protein N7499_004980 [Penicillium canescens]|nr:hypothetical protein N7522_004639 [Penicillium canescens]KAJ6040159.1 hypothetical protein N7444_009064 [Penicillium canescens]KAJ6085351.1 hypothetical protein N7499_004980 [Penicillium canescens]KAJ6162131.1 hypothetical protein N7485_010361 [Penicillium canescens]
MSSLSGNVVLVSGSSAGLNVEVVRELFTRGDSKRTICLKTDVSTPDEPQALVNGAFKVLKKVDI